MGFKKVLKIKTKLEAFHKLVRLIHHANKGWHTFEASNRLLLETKSDVDGKYFQKHYLKKKNTLQKRLESEFQDFIEILPPDETGFPSIAIKQEFQFDGYKDACHKLKEENDD